MKRFVAILIVAVMLFAAIPLGMVASAKSYGTVPTAIADKTHFVIDGVNRRISGNDAVIYTNAKDAIARGGNEEGCYNLVWTFNLLLEPTENANEYKLVIAEQSIGEAPAFSYVDVTNSMILVAIHSDGTVGTDHFNRRNAALELGPGTVLRTWEINLSGSNPDTKYLNSSVYVEKEVSFVDPDDDVVGLGMVDGKVQRDGDVALFETNGFIRRVSATEANLRNAYVLIFNEDGKLVKLGEKIVGSVQLPPYYQMLTFFYNEDNESNLALKILYDQAIESYCTDYVADNGMRTIDYELNCPYTMFFDYLEDGEFEYWITKTLIEDDYVPSAPDCIITVVTTDGGEVSPFGENLVKYGDDFEITVTPDDGYVIELFIANGEEFEDAAGLDESCCIQLENIREDTVVEVRFEEKGKEEDESSKEDSDVSGGNAGDVSDGSDASEEDDEEDDEGSSKRKKKNSGIEFWLPIIIVSVVSLLCLVVIIVAVVVIVKNARKDKKDGTEE